MSVIEAKRKQSGVQFLSTAMKMAEHTFRYTTSKKFDKCDKDVVRRIRDLNLEILQEVEKANAVFPKCQIDVEQRYIHFSSALGSCEALCSLLCVVKYSIISSNKVTNTNKINKKIKKKCSHSKQESLSVPVHNQMELLVRQ